ncbi:MAG: T9SS type A sorting domain-containing protein [Pedobacter sp.]|jgi:hypothetical protein
MKNLLLAVFIFLMAGTIVSQAQQVVDNFDSSAVNNVYVKINEGAPTTMIYTDNHADYQEGTGSFMADIKIGAFHDWGSYAEIQHAAADSGYLDFSGFDSLSIWIKVYEPATAPANMVFRVQFRDQPNPSDPVEQYVYENAGTLDAATGWFNLRLSLHQIPSDGSVNPNDQGFVITPSSWGLPKNNEILDYDKIISWGLVAVTTVNAADSVLVGFDDCTMFSPISLPAIVFNGIAFPSYVTTWAWGQSTIEVETGAGPLPNTNAIKWVQGDEWANGWTGIGTTIDPPFNLAVAWQQDSVKFKLKCQEGVGALRMQFEGGGGKVGTVFTPTTDNQWHDYVLPLREMVYQDGTTGFDSSAVGVVGLMAEATAIAGKVIYITDWWTGNPEFDVVPPDPPQNVSAFAGDKQNVITWDDVSGEEGEKYDVYYSKNPITDITAAGVEVVKFNIAENVVLATHLLLAPNTNQNTTYYYAIVCKDAAGNQSVVSLNSDAVTNMAKGVSTLSLNAPVFVADGDLSEWQSITPFRMFISEGNGYIAPNTQISSDADLSVLSWVAVDANYLYVAFDITDDVFVPSAQTTSYLNDCPDLFLGLYNWHGAPHGSLRRGANPDYHFRFAYNRVVLDGISGADSVVGLGENYYFGEAAGTGYKVEFRISWADLAVPGSDNVFVPVEGYRIPIDYSINDADLTNTREGIMCYSINNEDQSWGDVGRWSHTWIGNLWDPVGVENEGQQVTEYALTQNYPNPFNPSTQIKFALKEAGFVTLKVYDVLGKEVATLVKGDYTSGSYNVSFDASGLSSGIYFYRLESGSFVQTNKMMLLK